MRYIVILFFVGMITTASAQIERGLIAYYSFDDCSPSDTSGVSQDGIFVGNDLPDCVCGVSGNAVLLNGVDQHMILLGVINNYFEQDDFTLSMYIKSTSAAGIQTIMDKRSGCDANNSFGIRINPSANTVFVDLSEDNTISANVSTGLDFGSCWQHIAVTRAGSRTSLFLNGEFKGEAVTNTGQRVDIRNNSVLTIAGGGCVQSAVDNRFAGIIDEVKVFDRALSRGDIASLYLAPDKIETADTTVFLGNNVQIRTTNTCADDFTWDPVDGVSDADIANPIITPDETTTYHLVFSDDICASEDSIVIQVIDPAALGCGEVYLPNAFTPNGNNINDLYGISNPYGIQNLLSFEIFDRWGGRVFSTDNPFERWDGSFKGDEVNPGVMLYRVRFECDGKEDTAVGSFSIIR